MREMLQICWSGKANTICGLTLVDFYKCATNLLIDDGKLSTCHLDEEDLLGDSNPFLANCFRDSHFLHNLLLTKDIFKTFNTVAVIVQKMS